MKQLTLLLVLLLGTALRLHAQAGNVESRESLSWIPRPMLLAGPEFQLWLPSPASSRHFFFRETLGVYEFHATITDPADKTLTAQQTPNRSHAAFLDFTFGWRF